MKQVLLIIIFVTIGVWWGFSLVSPREESQQKSVVTATPTQTPTPTQVVKSTPVPTKVQIKNTYSKETRDAFLGGCGNTSNCKCIISEFEKSMTELEFLNEALEYDRTGQFPDSMMEAVLKCL